MSLRDLEVYNFQLSQVTEALERSPENQELLKLQSDLKELITLTNNLYNSEEASNNATAVEQSKSSSNSHKQRSKCPKLTEGQEVSVKSKDGKCRFGFILEADDFEKDGNVAGKILVKYADSENTEYVDANCLRAIDSEQQGRPAREKNSSQNLIQDKQRDDLIAPKCGNSTAAHLPPKVLNTPAIAAAALSASSGRHKKKYVKPKSGQGGGPSGSSGPPGSNRAENVHETQKKTWLSFVSSTVGGGSGDGKHSKRKVCSAPLVKPLLKKPSMFSTPDNPFARVGVVGSGKPMTKFNQRGKHVYSIVKT